MPGGIGEGFLDRTPKKQTVRLVFIKPFRIHTVKQMKWGAINWEKIFEINIHMYKFICIL